MFEINYNNYSLPGIPSGSVGLHAGVTLELSKGVTVGSSNGGVRIGGLRAVE